MVHKVTQLKDDDGDVYEGAYLYRGVEFDRNDTVPSGYFGRFEIKSGELRGKAYSKRSSLIRDIDATV